MNDESKIVVLTPVRNEDWILHQFLTITSSFADSIIVADQNSTDESKNICKQFFKVHLIENKSETYSEIERQNLLINSARKLFPNSKRILLALDVDEILTAESLLFSKSWEQIKTSAPGTTIYFEKPDMLPAIKKCVRYSDNYFPLGYTDDGTGHTAKTIHSRRIPLKADGESLYIDDIKFMHFAHVRKRVQSSKLRYYSVIENIKKINPLYLRRRIYPCNYDEQKFYMDRSFTDIPDAWLSEWDKREIELRDFCEPEFSWHDFEVLTFFKKFGYKKFHFDNIWCFDWEGCRKAAIGRGKEAPGNKVLSPGPIKNIIAKAIDKSYNLYRKFKN